MAIQIRWREFIVTLCGMTTTVAAMARTLAHYVVDLMPSRTAIIEAGALLPPSLRNGFVLHLLSAMAMRCNDLPASLTTNLGIGRQLHVKVSSSELAMLFGKPSLLTGGRSSLDLALALFQHASCFIDVGSNIGLYIFYLRCRDRSDKPIYFFESDPKLFEQLEVNIGANRIKHVTGYQVALANSSGKTVLVKIRRDDNSGDGDWSHPILERIEVERTSFADFVAGHNLEHVCAKVDVKGDEEAFFDGAKPTLGKLDYLIMEILDPAIKRGLPLSIIREGNFRAYYINYYGSSRSRVGEFRV